MQILWKNKNKRAKLIKPCPSNLPFESEHDQEQDEEPQTSPRTSPPTLKHKQSNSTSQEKTDLSHRYQAEGNDLAEEGKYREALVKWETAITLTPERAVLHEQKAQVLLELGETWKALQAATRATELEPPWVEAWVTLSRAQLNFGEPELSVQSAKKALELQPNCEDALDDMQTAMHLIANKGRLEQTCLQVSHCRYIVHDHENVHNSSKDFSHYTDDNVKDSHSTSPVLDDKSLLQ